MASNVQQANLTGLMTYVPTRGESRVEACKQVYEENRHRVYGWAFLMMDNEIAAEELMTNTFIRAFATSASPDIEAIDRALLTELREWMPVGALTLECSAATAVVNARANVKRVHLERAVVQIPATERMIFLMHDVEGYAHDRIARTVGISEDESRYGLHQARLRIRELVSTMKD
jgi:RNA polymerase sigma-70 factor (ECF subfamily)